jgi:PAS domain S-box-containing protein
MEKLFGYPRQELLGRKLEVLLPQRVRRRFVKNRQLCLSRRSEQITGASLELYGLRKDGTEFPIDVIFSPVEASGEVLVASSIREITSRKRAEELGSHLAAIVEASDDAIIGTDLDGTIVSWNKGAEKMCGYKAKEILGRSVSVFVPPDRLGEHSENLKRLRRGEHIQRFETTRIHKDGHPIDVSITISPVKGRSGVVVGASVVARDITEQRQAREALRLSEERFHVALKNAPVVVFSHDLQLRYTWINSPLLTMAPENYLGRTDAEVFGGEQGARLTAIKEEALRTGMDSRTEVTVTLKGERHCFDLVVEPLRNGGGKILGLLCSAIDITSFKETIDRLQEALNQVQLLSGLLPICASCKKIKDERERWQPLEGYIQSHSEAKFTHGICPDCMRKLYPEYCL